MVSSPLLSTVVFLVSLIVSGECIAQIRSNGDGKFNSLITTVDNLQRERQTAAALALYKNNALRISPSIFNNATWAVATLWLSGNGNSSVYLADVLAANNLLAKLCQENQINADDRTVEEDIYWYLPLLVRAILHPNIATQLNQNTKKAILNILVNYVKVRDNLDNAQLISRNLMRVYGSFNHNLLNQVTFSLVAQVLKGINGGDGLNIYQDGHTANEHYVQWAKFLKESFKNYALNGIDPEWGSPGYFSITVESVLNIIDLTSDEPLQIMATKYLHLYSAMAAITAIAGVRSGPKSRTYQNEWSYRGEADYFRIFSHLFSNIPQVLQTSWAVDRTRLALITSNYRLPDVISQLFHSEAYANNFFQQFHPIANAQQVISPDLSFYHYLYYQLTFPSYALASISGNDNFKIGAYSTFERSSNVRYGEIFSQNMWVGLITKVDVNSRIYFQNGLSVDDESSYILTFLGIQSVLHNHAMLVKPHANYQHTTSTDSKLYSYLSSDFRENIVYPSASNNYWIFSANADFSTYVGIKLFNANSNNSYLIDCNLPGPNSQINSAEKTCRISFSGPIPIIAVQVADASEFANFSQFQSAVSHLNFINQSDRIVLTELNGSKISLPANPINEAIPQINDTNLDLFSPNFYQGTFINSDLKNPKQIVINGTDLNQLRLDFGEETSIAIDPTPTPNPVSNPIPMIEGGDVFEKIEAKTQLWPASRLNDGDHKSCYSSYRGDMSNSNQEWIVAWMKTPQQITGLQLIPRLQANKLLAFPTLFQIYLSADSSGSWQFVKHYNLQELTLSDGNYQIDFGNTYHAMGIKILPLTLGIDDYQNYYLQICEMKIIRTGNQEGTPAPNLEFLGGPTIFSKSSAQTQLWPIDNLIDNNPNSCYSSKKSDYQNSSKEWLAVWFPKLKIISHIALTPRFNGTQIIAFPKVFSLYVTDEINSKWILIKKIDSSSLVLEGNHYILDLERNYLTKGIHLIPESLGPDNYGSYYLQLCNIEIREVL